MTYYISGTTNGDFDAIIGRVTEALKQEGFGVLTEIDVAKTLKAKLGVEFPRYRILGACNPGFAHQALSLEHNIGVMLPCNVIVRDAGEGAVEVSAIDPRAAMRQVGNKALDAIAEEVATRLARVVASV